MGNQLVFQIDEGNDDLDQALQGDGEVRVSQALQGEGEVRVSQ